jgi:hypothetical protein
MISVLLSPAKASAVRKLLGRVNRTLISTPGTPSGNSPILEKELKIAPALNTPRTPLVNSENTSVLCVPGSEVLGVRVILSIETDLKYPRVGDAFLRSEEKKMLPLVLCVAPAAMLPALRGPHTVSLHITNHLRKRDQALITRTNYLKKRDQALITRTNHLRKKNQVLATHASYLGEGVSQNQVLIVRDNCQMRSVRITAHASYLGEGVPLQTKKLSQRQRSPPQATPYTASNTASSTASTTTRARV